MSYAQAFFSGVAQGAINAIGQMAFGATGGVVLGDVSFSGMEVPEFITVGGEQKMVVHTLPGGERIVDLLGHEDRDLEWSGIMIDAFQGLPEQRARRLDQMRIDGPALPLQWGSWYYTVKVRDFHAETRYSQLHYRIRCLVLVNPAAPPPRAQPQTEDAVSSDLGDAQTSSPDTVKTSVASAQKTLPLPPSEVDAIVPGTPTNTGMDTATGEIVAAPNDVPPAEFVDEFGRTQSSVAPALPPQPVTISPPASATVSTQGSLMPAATPAQNFTSSPFIN